MANFNKVILIGRLTRDPETRTFSTGGKVAKFGFAVTNRKKNSQTGQWEDEPMFIDVEVYNRGEYGKTADMVEERLRKGSQVCLEGRLHLDQWDDKQTGAKRSKHKLVVESLQMLDGRPEGGTGGGGGAPARSSAPARSNGAQPARGGYSAGDEYGDDEGGDHGGGGGQKNDDIPF
jgi:single-strand DNA-binding protein